MAQVGTAYVTIKPDLRGFGEELKRGLEKIHPEVEVNVKPDLKGFRTELRDQLREIRQQVKVGVKPDLTGFSRMLREELSARNMPTVKVPVEPNIRFFRTKLRAALRAMSLEEVAVRVRVNVREVIVEPGGGGGGGRRNSPEEEGRSWASKFFAGAKAQFAEAGRALGQTFSGNFGAVFSNWITATIVTVLAAFSAPLLATIVGGLGTAFVGFAFGGLGAFLLQNNKPIVDAFQKLGLEANKAFIKAAGPLVTPILQAIDILRKNVGPVADLLKPIFAAIGPHIPILATGIAGFLTEFLKVMNDPETLKRITLFMDAFSAALPRLGEEIGKFIKDLGGNDPERAAKLFTTILITLGDIIHGIGAFIGWLVDVELWLVDWGRRIHIWWDNLINWFATLPDRVRKALSRLAEPFVRYGGSVMLGLVTGMMRAWTSVQSFMLAIPTRLGAYLRGVPDAMFRAGANVVRGFIDGLRSMIPSLSNVGNLLASAIPNVVKLVLNQHSPSKVMMAIGTDAVRGLVIGMESSLMPVTDAANAVAQAAIPTVAMGADGLAPASSPISVRVYIGERELTDIVRVEIDDSNDETARAMMAGRRT